MSTKNFLAIIALVLVLQLTLSTNSFLKNKNALEDNEKDNVYNLTENTESPFKVHTTGNQKITFSIKGNITTGYQWVLENESDINKSIIEPQGLEKENTGHYQQDPHPKGFVGSGGKFIFNFKTGNKGEQVLDFDYKRTFEKENNQNKHIKVIVYVE